MRLLILLLLLATPAFAQSRIDLKPIFVRNGEATIASAQSYYSMLEATRIEYAKIGIFIRVLKLKLIDDPCPQYNTFALQTQKLLCLGAVARRLKLLRNGQITHFTLPVMLEASGQKLLGGLARTTCARRYGRLAYLYSYSIANAAEISQSGESRYRHSEIAMKHEIGHVLGAEHDDYSPNIMHSAANIFVKDHWPLKFNQPAIDQIKRCLK